MTQLYVFVIMLQHNINDVSFFILFFVNITLTLNE